jgi:hypothetical protein
VRKSTFFFFLIAPLLSYAAASASPLQAGESNTRVLASSDAGGAARCSLDPQFVAPDNRASASWSSELNRNAFDAANAGYQPDDRWTPRGGLVYDEAAAQTPLLVPRLREPHRHWLPAGANEQPNADANAAVNHLFAPPDAVNLFVTQTGNDRTKGVRDSNATLAAVQLVIH